MFGLASKEALWWANEIRIWAAALAGLAALVAFASQYAQIRISDIVSKEKDSAFRQYQLEAEERIAVAQSDARRAEKSIAVAQQEAAASLAEAERLKARFAWRELSPKTDADLIDKLKDASGPVTIAWIANDPETLAYAQLIGGVFNRAGWTVFGQARTYPSSIIEGLSIPGLRTPAISAIRRAFRSAGISFSTNDVPQAPMHYAAGEAPEGTPLIMIGSKPRTFVQ